jgi:tryptophan synthase alpha chain
VPIVLLSYWNPIIQYGNGRPKGTNPNLFVRDATRCGVCGIIVPDLPPEEAQAFRSVAEQVGIATVFLAAPTSPPPRLRQVAQASSGFIYYVSVTGTTGVRERLPREWLHGVRQLKRITTKPICVGFGISRPSQAKAVAGVADGVIVGSALLQAMEPALRQKRRMVREAFAFVNRFRKVV